jgi:hypothetical protein
VHDAIRVRLETVDGLRAFSYPPQGGTPPVAYVILENWDPATFGRSSLHTYQFSVLVFTASSARPQDGYTALMEYADPTGSKSINLAIWDGQAAGVFAGLANTTATVTHFEVLGAEQIDAYEAYGGLFTVTVTTST